MKLSIRLSQLLESKRHPKRGLIKRICERTGLERHKISDLIYNKAQYISRDVLARVCDYLVEHEGYDPQDLPGLLFSRDPENFWQLLAQRDRLELCLGVRQFEESEHSFVIASDSKLQGALMHGITGLGHSPDDDTAGPGTAHPHQQGVEFQFVPAPSRAGAAGNGHDSQAVQREAEKVYTQFAERTDDRALICVGSMKVNPVVEIVLANAFRARPFHSEDHVPHPRDRHCPFLLRFRPEDPKPPSCCGGMQLSQDQAVEQPGIYFEKANGKWECCPCDSTHDAGLIFYTFRKTEGRLEMVVGGFSSRATDCLVNLLRGSTAQLWPPSYETSELMVGTFVVTFHFPPTGKEPTSRVIALDAKVIKRRLAKTAH